MHACQWRLVKGQGYACAQLEGLAADKPSGKGLGQKAISGPGLQTAVGALAVGIYTIVTPGSCPGHTTMKAIVGIWARVGQVHSWEC